jgi:peroxiredoxin
MSGFGGLEKEFAEADAQVLGISVDPFPSLGAWSKELGLWFPLLSDWPKYAVSKAYGVFNEERSTANRVTFVIDREGVVRHAIADEADMDRHANESLETLRKLNSDSAD